ncbi:hypothetical protein N7470_005078 [Penicillium chermesinum]|nr:hypothetical protein N7470_005078 [Penicillium chermesinum]
MMASPTRTVSSVPSTPRSPRTIKRLNGLYKEGVWCCNCADRPQAVRFQVKKVGKNHGRWFYTCQKQPKCGFFLWDDDAQIRAKAVILANNRSELDPILQTPTKPNDEFSNIGLLTPQTERPHTERKALDTTPRTQLKITQFKTPPTSAKARMMAEDTDEFGWDDSDNEEYVEATSIMTENNSFMSQPNFHPESPTKVPRTPKTSSPGKRKFADLPSGRSSMIADTASESPPASFSSRFPPASAEVCMTPTPTKYRDVLSSDSRADSCSLSQHIMSILDRLDVVIPNNARDEIIELVNRENKKNQGIIRSRDILRTAIKKKDEEIVKLKERNTNLKAQVELRNMANKIP